MNLINSNIARKSYVGDVGGYAQHAEFLDISAKALTLDK